MTTAVRKKEIQDEVKKILTAYLEQQKFRKTPERFKIIDEIYSRDDHFDADTLYADLKKKKLFVIVLFAN